MPIPKVTIDGVSVVMRGSLNPAIFQPVWFSANGLAKKRDADDALVGVVHPEFTAFQMGSIDLTIAHGRRYHSV